jgi:23S rRNA (uracil1939-C5)-methyltransferase
VAESKIFKGAVRALSSDGHGVVNHPESGRVFFVPGTWVGDEGQFEVESVGAKFGRAKLSSLDVPANERIASPCSHHGTQDGQCGGCPWSFVTYAAQLEAKAHRIVRSLERAHVSFEKFLGVLPSQNEWGYRNRAQFKTNGKVIGYVSEASHTIAPIETCKVLNLEMSVRLNHLRQKLPNSDWVPGTGFDWNFLDLSDEHPETIDQLQINRRSPFKQGNTQQNGRMKEWLKEQEGYVAGRNCLELFCGSGNFTEVLLELAPKKLWAFEASAEAIDEAKKKVTGIAESPKGAVLSLGVSDLYHPAAQRVLVRDTQEAQTLILDPPRLGFRDLGKVAKALPKLSSVIYISCDPATFARDAQGLLAQGFALRTVQGIDLFPQTPHVELLSVFSR